MACGMTTAPAHRTPHSARDRRLWPFLMASGAARRPVLHRSGHFATAIGYNQGMSVVEQEVASPHPPSPKGMVWLPGGSFRMGSADFYPEEQPVHDVGVDGFWMDEHPVTVAQFRRFVKATGHVTDAERAPDPADYPDADPALLVPGSLVFHRAAGPVALDDFRNWWAWVPGADWRHPEGPHSTVDGRQRHPVTHVTYADAIAYARWAGKQLATEAEWEFAARGGLDGATFVWGDEFAPGGRMMANTWQGEFPWQNLMLDKYDGTSPVGAFPVNGYGLADMAGNVWEWTADFFTPNHSGRAHRRSADAGSRSAVGGHASCCVPANPRVDEPAMSESIPRRVIKGGSHLCAPNYCLRYRPAARQGEAVDTSTGHLGFRCIVRL
jgi:sulfatase modifying factor 1